MSTHGIFNVSTKCGKLIVRRWGNKISRFFESE